MHSLSLFLFSSTASSFTTSSSSSSVYSYFFHLSESPFFSSSPAPLPSLLKSFINVKKKKKQVFLFTCFVGYFFLFGNFCRYSCTTFPKVYTKNQFLLVFFPSFVLIRKVSFVKLIKLLQTRRRDTRKRLNKKMVIEGFTSRNSAVRKSLLRICK